MPSPPSSAEPSWRRTNWFLGALVAKVAASLFVVVWLAAGLRPWGIADGVSSYWEFVAFPASRGVAAVALALLVATGMEWLLQRWGRSPFILWSHITGLVAAGAMGGYYVWAERVAFNAEPDQLFVLDIHATLPERTLVMGLLVYLICLPLVLSVAATMALPTGRNGRDRGRSRRSA